MITCGFFLKFKSEFQAEVLLANICFYINP